MRRIKKIKKKAGALDDRPAPGLAERVGQTMSLTKQNIIAKQNENQIKRASDETGYLTPAIKQHTEKYFEKYPISEQDLSKYGGPHKDRNVAMANKTKSLVKNYNDIQTKKNWNLPYDFTKLSKLTPSQMKAWAPDRTGTFLNNSYENKGKYVLPSVFNSLSNSAVKPKVQVDPFRMGYNKTSKGSTAYFTHKRGKGETKGRHRVKRLDHGAVLNNYKNM